MFYTLIDHIELKPVKIKDRKMIAIELHSHLADMLSLENKDKLELETAWWKRALRLLRGNASTENILSSKS